MSAPSANFIVRHTFIEVQDEVERETARRKLLRRNTTECSFTSAIKTTVQEAIALESESRCFGSLSTCDSKDVSRIQSLANSVNDDSTIVAPSRRMSTVSVASVISYASSVDSDDIIGSASLSLSAHWSAAAELHHQALAPTSSIEQVQPVCNSNESPSVPDNKMEDEKRTTIMLRNLPAGLSQADFVKKLQATRYNGLFDFVHMPMTLKADGNFGYAFVNFIDAKVAVDLMRRLQSLEFVEKEWRGVWSKNQGMRANVEHYRNSPIMHAAIPEDCKPALYDERGIRVQFPAPTKAIPAPRILQSKDIEKNNDFKDGVRKPVAAVCSNKGDNKPRHRPRKNINRSTEVAHNLPNHNIFASD